MNKLVKVKTADLIGAALDWAICFIEKVDYFGPSYDNDGKRVIVASDPIRIYSPSTDWSQGGPLIDKYHMDFCCEHPETIGSALCDENGMYIDDRMMFGKTHLIAACRAIVASVLGDTVSVPKELLS